MKYYYIIKYWNIIGDDLRIFSSTYVLLNDFTWSKNFILPIEGIHYPNQNSISFSCNGNEYFRFDSNTTYINNNLLKAINNNFWIFNSYEEANVVAKNHYIFDDKNLIEQNEWKVFIREVK